MILCWAAFIAILGCMRSAGQRLDTLYPIVYVFLSAHSLPLPPCLVYYNLYQNKHNKNLSNACMCTNGVFYFTAHHHLLIINIRLDC